MSVTNALKLYPGPTFARESKDYYVEANGQPVYVHAVTVSSMPTNELWRGTQRTVEETEQASFFNFDFEGSVTLRIVCAWEIFYARVLPAAKGIIPVRGTKNKGDEVTFTITEPMLRYWNRELKHVSEKGAFEVFLGRDSSCQPFAGFTLI